MARVQVREPIPDDEVVDQQPAIPQQPVEPTPIQPYQQVPSKSRNLITKSNMLIGSILVIIVIVIIAIVSLLNGNKHLKNEVNKLSTTQTNSAANDAQKYQEEVAKLVDVPQGITPVAKTLSDTEISQLSKDNPIYKSAKNGDVFLLYTYPDKSLFLVVYRPSDHKVVLATLGSQQASPAPVTTKP